ncbi:MAG: prephenate dehydratase [Candidatus Gastranaerophilales bacterium]|nr:prephenate dehydratase [Candidatus Gastranaerophilales bacterium]
MDNSKKLLYLGPRGTYSDIAVDVAKKILPFLEEFEPVPVFNINEIIVNVDKNPDCVAVVPVENSIEGLVRETVDKIVRTENYIRVFQEVIVPVANCLISNSGDITKVRKIISHPQPLAQCNNYIHSLEKKLGLDIELIPSTSTSKAISELGDFADDAAAIGNEKAAALYGKKIVEKNINDEPDNKTRFLCIGRTYPSASGNDRTSIAFSTLNQPGALVSVLNVLKDCGLNMSCIDSRPSKKNLGEYMFYVDIDGHVEDENVKNAIELIKPMTTFYRLIGSYPKFQ